jgi:long-chain acyl-CoA synthetase
MNLAHALDATATRTPESVALVFEGAEVTFAQMRARSLGAADVLAARGVGPGDRVAIWVPNHPSFASAMYGAWRLGAVAVPVHAALTEPEVKHILGDAGAKVVVCGPDQRDVGGSLVDALGLEDLPLEGSERAVVEPGESDLALIQYTAGTSGLPKGAMLSHANLKANIDQMREVPIAIGPDDVALCVLPLFHIFGLNVVLNLAIEVGATVVLSERFDPVGSLDLIKANLVTMIAGAPPVYVAWLMGDAPRDALSNVRVAVSGAAPLAKDVLAGFKERFDITIWEGYGLTETSPALTSTAIGGVPKPNCVGRPLPGVEIKLIDEDGDEVEDEGDPGEIVVRGPNVFSGYWNRPEESKAAFTEDGWFRSGDVGVFDDDGDLYIVDRKKDMVLVSGFNVYPREIEDVLRRYPNVGDVAVVGIPDEIAGERIRAIVVPDPPGEEISVDELLAFCAKSLAPYKTPKEIEVVADIPRNAAGKVLRRELRRS